MLLWDALFYLELHFYRVNIDPLEGLVSKSLAVFEQREDNMFRQ